MAHTHVKTMCQDQPVVSQLLRPLLSPFLGKSLSSQSPTNTKKYCCLRRFVLTSISSPEERQNNALQSPSHLSHSVSSQYFYISSIVFRNKDSSKAINNCQFKFIPPSSTCEIAERSEGCSTQQQDMTYSRHQDLFYLCSGACLLESATQYYLIQAQKQFFQHCTCMTSKIFSSRHFPANFHTPATFQSGGHSSVILVSTYHLPYTYIHRAYVHTLM